MRHPQSTLHLVCFFLCRNGASFHKTIKQTGVSIWRNKLLLVQTQATQETKYLPFQLCVLWKFCTSCQSLRARSDRKIPRNNRCGYRRGVCGCVCVSVCVWGRGEASCLISIHRVYTDGERQDTHGIRHLLLSLAHFAASMLHRKPKKEKRKREG